MEAKAIADTEKCLTDIKTWMDHNRLCMNNAKLSSSCFGSRQQTMEVYNQEFQCKWGRNFPTAIALSTLAYG